MKYKAHLTTGAVIEMTFNDTPEAFMTSGWIVDDNGMMVSAAHLIAMEPVLTDESFVDRDGDRWCMNPDGKYSMVSNYSRTREEIERLYGVKDDAPELPTMIIDKDDDVWKLSPEDGEGMYRCIRMPYHDSYTIDQIRAKYGIKEGV